MRGPNVLSFQLVSGATRWYIVGCYIPPNYLTTITHVEQAWQACPRGCLPILLGNLNVNLAPPRDEHNKTIAKQVDAMALVDMSSHFCQCCRRNSGGRWTWRMRRGRRWVSSQCDYVLERVTNLGRWFWCVSVRMPFCHNSDHRALVAKIRVGGGGEMAKYQKQYQCFPLKIPQGPCTELASKYQELRLDIIPCPMRECPANQWILDKTWAAIDKQATLRRQGRLTTCVAHQMGREIKSFLVADCKQRAANATSTIESHLSTGAVKEAWRALKGWYRSAEVQSPPACPETMV